MTLIGSVIPAQQKIVPQRHIGENLTALRDVRDAHSHDAVRWQVVDASAGKFDAAPRRWHDATDGMDGGCFSGPIGPNQRDHLSLFHLKIQADHGPDLAIVDVKAFHLQ
jgi:hypothetical protein